jgi:hypothetical protein
MYSCNSNKYIETGFPSFITIPRLDFISWGFPSGLKSYSNSDTLSKDPDMEKDNRVELADFMVGRKEVSKTKLIDKGVLMGLALI